MEKKKWPLAIIGRGEGTKAAPGKYRNRMLGEVFSADAAAWVAVAAVDRAFQASGNRSKTPFGVITIGEEGPMASRVDFTEGYASGRISPLKYVNGNPGSIAGLICSVFAAKAPSLNLTMPLASGLGDGLTIAAEWLKRSGIHCVAICGYSQGTARCLLVTEGPESSELEALIDWFCHKERTVK